MSIDNFSAALCGCFAGRDAHKIKELPFGDAESQNGSLFSFEIFLTVRTREVKEHHVRLLARRDGLLA